MPDRAACVLSTRKFRSLAGGTAIAIALDTSTSVSESDFLTARSQVWHANTYIRPLRAAYVMCDFTNEGVGAMHEPPCS